MDARHSKELLPGQVLDKLAALRRALTGRLLVEGLAWLAASLVALIFVTLAFDYFLRLERDLRGLIMALALAGVLAVVWRQIIRPLRVPMDAAGLALLVERRFGQLGDRLISAIQLARRNDEELGISQAMIRRVADEAAAMALPLPFQDIVERRGIFRTWSVAGCALGLLLGFAIWQGDILGRWFLRNVLFSDIPWPQKTYLAVQGGPDFTILRGDDLEVVVEVEPRSQVIPDHLTLHAEYSTVGWTEERLEADHAHPHRFVKLFPTVPERFKFYVTGGDDRRDARRPHEVFLVDPPAFRAVRFTVKYPVYTRRSEADRLEGGTGALIAPVGATVTVEGVPNKPLEAATILLDDAPAGTMDAVGGGELYAGRFEIAGENKPSTRTLRFELTDQAGHTSRRGAKYMVQVQPDSAPVLDLKKQRIGSRISPRAAIPLQLHARDEYGLTKAEVVAARILPAKDANARPLALPPDVGREAALDAELDIEPLRLKPGQTLYVLGRAADTLPPSFGGPNVGESSPLSFVVAKPEDLMEEFLRRQKELRLEFIQAEGLQESARAKTEGAKAVFAAGRADAEGRRLMTASSALQQNVGAEVAKAADTLAAIVDEMQSNRIGTQTEREQIRAAVVEPLKGLAEPIRAVTASANATAAVAEARELADQAGKIEQAQREIYRQMDEIRERMAKIESKQELASKLQVIIDWSEQLLKTIQKKQEAEVGNIFDPATRPAPAPPKD